MSGGVGLGFFQVPMAEDQLRGVQCSMSNPNTVFSSFFGTFSLPEVFLLQYSLKSRYVKVPSMQFKFNHCRFATIVYFLEVTR